MQFSEYVILLKFLNYIKVFPIVLQLHLTEERTKCAYKHKLVHFRLFRSFEKSDQGLFETVEVKNSNQKVHRLAVVARRHIRVGLASTFILL